MMIRTTIAIAVVFGASIWAALAAYAGISTSPQIAILSCGLFIASIVTAALIGLAVGVEFAAERADRSTKRRI